MIRQRKQPPYKPRYIIIVGCGRLGSLLAGHLSQQGDSIVVIDHDEGALDALPAAFSGFRIEGNATDLEVLRRAKIDRTDGLIAATSEDNVNLMVAQVASTLFGVPAVVARVHDPASEALYKKLGVVTISPTLLAKHAFLEALASPREEVGA